MAKSKPCNKKCRAQSEKNDCDNDVCPVKKSKTNKLLSLAIDSWKSVMEVCDKLSNKKDQ